MIAFSLYRIAKNISAIDNSRIALKYKGKFKNLKQEYPNIPDYVIKDVFLEFSHQDITDLDIPEVKQWLSYLNSKKWKKKILTINFKDFSTESRKRMQDRKFGESNPYGIPKDKERFETQEKILSYNGKNEPVVYTAGPDGYSIEEGWHRTMTILKSGKNDSEDPRQWDPVKINAWVGY